MLDNETRRAILKLKQQGHGSRKIAQDLGISRNSVREVVRSGVAEVSGIERDSKFAGHIEAIRAAYQKCSGNMVRVQEVLSEQGIELKYSTLTQLCRNYHISRTEKVPVAMILTGPGLESQTDTSPYKIEIGGKKVLRHCASYVLGFSRRLFIQFYPRFTRFECKTFLTDCFQYLQGLASRCVIDNTHVVVACGTGKRAQFAPEMEAFEKRFGFKFLAHELGHFKRKGKVERNFDFIQKNFLAGRTFKDDEDLNQQAIQWCQKKADTRILRGLGKSPEELFVMEKTHLVPLPLYVPEVYRIFQRVVDVYGYISLHDRKYSVPAACISRGVEVRETKKEIIVYDGRNEVARHKRLTGEAGPSQSTLPEHRPKLRRHRQTKIYEQARLESLPEPMPAYLQFLKKEYAHRYVYSLKQLYLLYCEYTTEHLLAAVGRALEYKLRDVRRLENIILARIAKNDFLLPISGEPQDYQANPEFLKGQHTPCSNLANYDFEEKEPSPEENTNDRGNTSLPERDETQEDGGDR